MKKFYIPYIVFCAILLTLFAINISEVPQKAQPNVNMPTPIKENTEIKPKEIKTTEEKEIYYYVKSSGESIFLYDNNDNVIKKLNIDFNNLREYDKTQFVTGIKIKTMDEVYQLLEDFSN